MLPSGLMSRVQSRRESLAELGSASSATGGENAHGPAPGLVHHHSGELACASTAVRYERLVAAGAPILMQASRDGLAGNGDANGRGLGAEVGGGMPPRYEEVASR